MAQQLRGLPESELLIVPREPERRLGHWKPLSLRLKNHSGNQAGSSGLRAAECVRMSTEHPKYSTENQAEAIRYAARSGLEIARTHADEGKSGLRLTVATHSSS
jgi:hypothetical protein